MVVTDADNYEVYYEEPTLTETQTESLNSDAPEVSSENTKESSGTGWIAGIVIAVIAVLGIGGVVVYYRKKKK